MSDNTFIEEDFERVYMQERAYIEEQRRRELNEEWERWEITQLGFERQPARIKVEMPKTKEVNRDT